MSAKLGSILNNSLMAKTKFQIFKAIRTELQILDYRDRDQIKNCVEQQGR